MNQVEPEPSASQLVRLTRLVTETARQARLLRERMDTLMQKLAADRQNPENDQEDGWRQAA